jgi:signal transduction histidine kinase
LRRRVAQLEREAIVGRRVAVVLHDVAKPLAVIQVHARRLASSGGSPERVRQLGSEIVALSVDALAVVEGLLSSTRPEEGRPSRSVALRELLVQAQAAAQRLHPTHRVETGEPIPQLVIDQPEELLAVLVNLMDNAMHACARDQVVRVEASIADEHLRLEVADSGTGMSESVRAQAADPYFTTRERGLGLGLASARARIGALGGRLELDSKPGQGTRAAIRLPLASVKSGPQPLATPA